MLINLLDSGFIYESDYYGPEYEHFNDDRYPTDVEIDDYRNDQLDF